MLRLLADENLDNRIGRALRLREPCLNLVRVQDVGLTGADDPKVLDWAAHEGRIVLTHDASTMTRYAYQRVGAGEPMPGVIEIVATAPLGVVIEDLLLVVQCSLDDEWAGQVLYVPLR